MKAANHTQPSARTVKRTLRLTNLIKREIEQVGNPNQLAARINRKNEESGSSARVTRKGLLGIRDNPTGVSLTVDMLTALDIYFAPRGESLQDRPIFEKPGILECLVQKRKVSFLMAAKPRPADRRRDISRWDARSLAELLSEAGKFDVRMEYEIEEVLLERGATTERLGQESWYKLIDRDDRALVSIGSPLACLASEVMLARMFGVEEFKPTQPSLAEPHRVPFYFAWPPKAAGNRRSAFALNARQLESFDLRVARRVAQGQACALVLGGVPSGVSLGKRPSPVYGVIAAQRRKTGGVWLVVSGLSGPATYAAARLVRTVTAELPWPNGGVSPVLWMPIQAEISCRGSQEELGDNREVDSASAFRPPSVWPPAQAPEGAVKPSARDA